MKHRKVFLTRKTRETEIKAELDLDEYGTIAIETTIPFFNHLLKAMAFHGRFNMRVECTGDTEVDPHHLIEDTGLVLGELLLKLSSDFGNIRRFGHGIIPMDEALSEVTIDVCGRPSLVLSADLVSDGQKKIGHFDPSLIREFLKALSDRARISLHAQIRYGENLHHMVESLFKALGRALQEAYSKEDEIMSTKGTLLL